ncbi:MAG TPA: hypothetical protein VFR31_03475 [Thermoanaerobaculia bacterium]|nr:hypothetical protein [Thermoanaerobaculia bacterium]
MVVDLPPPPAPVTARIELSSTLPAAPPPYEYRLAGEGETSPTAGSLLHGADRVNPARADAVARTRPAGVHGKYASASPIQLILDRLGFYLGTLFPEIRSGKVTKMPVKQYSGSGLGEGSPDPVPTGDPIPVGGGGNPGGNPGG